MTIVALDKIDKACRDLGITRSEAEKLTNSEIGKMRRKLLFPLHPDRQANQNVDEAVKAAIKEKFDLYTNAIDVLQEAITDPNNFNESSVSTYGASAFSGFEESASLWKEKNYDGIKKLLDENKASIYTTIGLLNHALPTGTELTKEEYAALKDLVQHGINIGILDTDSFYFFLSQRAEPAVIQAYLDVVKQTQSVDSLFNNMIERVKQNAPAFSDVPFASNAICYDAISSLASLARELDPNSEEYKNCQSAIYQIVVNHEQWSAKKNIFVEQKDKILSLAPWEIANLALAYPQTINNPALNQFNILQLKKQLQQYPQPVQAATKPKDTIAAQNQAMPHVVDWSKIAKSEQENFSPVNGQIKLSDLVTEPSKSLTESPSNSAGADFWRVVVPLIQAQQFTVTSITGEHKTLALKDSDSADDIQKNASRRAELNNDLIKAVYGDTNPSPNAKNQLLTAIEKWQVDSAESQIISRLNENIMKMFPEQASLDTAQTKTLTNFSVNKNGDVQATVSYTGIYINCFDPDQRTVKIPGNFEYTVEFFNEEYLISSIQCSDVYLQQLLENNNEGKPALTQHLQLGAKQERANIHLRKVEGAENATQYPELGLDITKLKISEILYTQEQLLQLRITFPRTLANIKSPDSLASFITDLAREYPTAYKTAIVNPSSLYQTRTQADTIKELHSALEQNRPLKDIAYDKSQYFNPEQCSNLRLLLGLPLAENAAADNILLVLQASFKQAQTSYQEAIRSQIIGFLNSKQENEDQVLFVQKIAEYTEQQYPITAPDAATKFIDFIAVKTPGALSNIQMIGVRFRQVFNYLLSPLVALANIFRSGAQATKILQFGQPKSQIIPIEPKVLQQISAKMLSDMITNYKTKKEIGTLANFHVENYQEALKATIGTRMPADQINEQWGKIKAAFNQKHPNAENEINVAQQENNLKQRAITLRKQANDLKNSPLSENDMNIIQKTANAVHKDDPIKNKEYSEHMSKYLKNVRCDKAEQKALKAEQDLLDFQKNKTAHTPTEKKVSNQQQSAVSQQQGNDNVDKERPSSGSNTKKPTRPLSDILKSSGTNKKDLMLKPKPTPDSSDENENKSGVDQSSKTPNADRHSIKIN
jgi:hypothetical protein